MVATAMPTDLELLSRYVTQGCEASFGELVTRHADLVYSTAARLVGGDSHLARDVAQSVFADLARKAAAVCRTHAAARQKDPGTGFCLAGWLYTGTRFAAAKMVRREQTRHRYEQEAQAMMLPAMEDERVDLPLLRALLDEAMGQLPPLDRDAVVLRFFQGLDLRGVGSLLGLSEEAARKRVARALQKLRSVLQQRGLTTSVGALSLALSTLTVQAAPVGLAASLTAGALAAKPLGLASVSNLFTLMLHSKIKLSLAGICLLAIATPLLLQRPSTPRVLAAKQSLPQNSEGPADHSNSLGGAGSSTVPPLPTASVAPIFPTWSSIQSDDVARYASNLRAAGVPEVTLRDIILAEIDRQYAQKKREVLAGLVVNRDYWKVDGQSSTAGPEITGRLQELAKEKESLIRTILNLETDQRTFAKAFNPQDVEEEVATKWSYVSSDKRERLKDLTIAFRRELPEGVGIDWNNPHWQAAEQAYEAKVQELLSAEELETHQLRYSNLASRLRMELQEFQPTEAEFRSIFRLLHESGRSNLGSSIASEDLAADGQVLGQPELRAKLLNQLGESRLTELDQKFQSKLPDQGGTR